MKAIQVFDGDGSRTDIPRVELCCNVLHIATDHRAIATLELRFLRGDLCRITYEACALAWARFDIRVGQRMALLVIQQNRRGDVQKRDEFEGFLLDASQDNIEGKPRLTISLELTA